MEATLQVLERDGYAQLTTTRVAERAGVSVGTLYQYFPDKRALVTALKVHYLGLLAQAFTAALAATKATDLETLLRVSLDALLGVKREHLALTRAIREPLAELGGFDIVREALQEFVAHFAPAVTRALPELIHVERRATLLIAALEGAISYAAYHEPEWLAEPWFLDELVLLSGGFLETLAARQAANVAGKPLRTPKARTQRRKSG